MLFRERCQQNCLLLFAAASANIGKTLQLEITVNKTPARYVALKQVPPSSLWPLVDLVCCFVGVQFKYSPDTVPRYANGRRAMPCVGGRWIFYTTVMSRKLAGLILVR